MKLIHEPHRGIGMIPKCPAPARSAAHLLNSTIAFDYSLAIA